MAAVRKPIPARGDAVVCRSMKLATAQEEVRALLQERYAHGIGVEIESELGVAKSVVYQFHGGHSPFPSAKLDALRSFLLREREDPQAKVRALFVASLAQKRVRSIDIARRFDVNKATVSRFKDGALPFPASKLDALDAYLRASTNEPRDEKTASRPAGEAPVARARARRPRFEAASAMHSTRAEQIEAALVAQATRFAWALIEAARQHAIVAELDESNAFVERALAPRQ